MVTSVSRRPREKRKATTKPEAPSVTAPAPSITLEEMPSASTPSTPADLTDVTYTVAIRYRTHDGVQSLPLTTDDRSFYPYAQKWRYVVANRKRITPPTRSSLVTDITQWLSQVSGLDLHVLDARVKAIARSDTVEVAIPYSKEDVGWAARVFPWENALGLLTRDYRDETAPFTIIRHLAVHGAVAPVARRPASLVVVRSGPGEIGKRWDLDRECQLVVETMRQALSTNADHVLRDPDRKMLEAEIKNVAPDIIHVSGVDPVALEGQGLLRAEPEKRDGFVLRGAESGFDVVDAGVFAGIVTAAATKPLLVAVTSCYSASRIAALSVAGGASHAIGFIDTLTDADAVLFFGFFYRAWMRNWDTLAAFAEARREWTAQASAQSTGVVLWSRHSLFEAGAAVAAVEPEPAGAAPVERARVPRVTVADLKLYVALVRDRGPGGTSGNSTSLNYSLLHNDRTPFSSFLIEKPLAGRLPPLQIDVSLEVGDELCRCRFSEELAETATTLELARRIRLPLVAGLLRQCTESLRTNLYIKVMCGDRLLRESSERVTVLPADEWRDDGEDHRWLPSFVLPRDPAVLKVIDAAQRYLRTLLDDCSAGFDGYQQLFHDDSNASDVVDPQVQSIWAALQHDLPINYINPPPSYTSQSQRLRSPSEIFRGHAATCIDLALLFASCLEFIGIYPVIFLISGHAFPGYWRSDKGWWRMKQFHFSDGAASNEPLSKESPVTPTSGQSESWMFDVDNLAELLRYVQEGSLVPFESTFVARQRGFLQSLEEGSGRLHPDSFDAMIDVQSARGAGVTPLPLFDKFS